MSNVHLSFLEQCLGLTVLNSSVLTKDQKKKNKFFNLQHVIGYS